MKSVDSINIWNLVPSSLTQVVCNTDLNIQRTVVSCNHLVDRARCARLSTCQYTCVTIIVVSTYCIVYIKVDSPLVIDLELVQDTNTNYRSIAVSAHVTVNTKTCVRDAIPNTSLVVTTQHIANIEQNLLI